MIRQMIALSALLTICSLALAATPSGTSAATPEQHTAKTAQEKAGDSRATTDSGARQTSEKKLDAAAVNKKQDLKTAVSKAIKIFVPSEQIDVDKPVDFPTNI